MTIGAPGLVVVRGAGDLASGVIWRMARAGWPVIACELAEPLTVRRTVAFSSAVRDRAIEIDGVRARLCAEAGEARQVAETGEVAVIVSPTLPAVAADVVVDARLAKRRLDTTIDDADLVVALGPGFTAGVDCDAVVETMRGHHLGRVLWTGSPLPNTGTPGLIAGRGAERVLRSPNEGRASWQVAIGDRVAHGQLLGSVAGATVVAPFDGVVRGLIAESVTVPAGLKIGDIDPRLDMAACHQIGDKALAVAGGVVEAVLTWGAAQRA